ncbi:hypothetical protein F4703DRAFT_1905796 [Phycomyces blakesleeanus]
MPFLTKMSSTLLWFQALLVFISLASVMAQNIKVEKTGFDRVPDKLFYFQGSQVALWFDAGARVLWRSSDQGKAWTRVTDIAENEPSFLYEHPFDNEKAYVIGKGKVHWKTVDRGASWQKFETPIEPAATFPHLSFHAERPNYVLFNGFKCNLGGWTGMDCHGEFYYTLNNFEETALLRSQATYCIWSLSSAAFETAPVKEVMCVEPAKKSGMASMLEYEELHLVQSEDFFKNEQAVNFGSTSEVRGVIAISAVNRFLVAAIKPKPSEPDMDLQISLDGENWHEAIFPVDAKLVHEKAYTIVESTGTSLLVDVLDSASSTVGTLYKSNSNGTFFVKSLENTNRNQLGIVDFERVQGVEGVMVANVVSNAAQVKAGSAKKALQTRMSFDDGATWSPIQKVYDAQGTLLKCSDGPDKCALHLHSVTTPRNNGQVFTSKAAVGVMMGVGSYNDHLLEYDESDTFLSTDGGLNWKLVRMGAHKYEFGDMGALLVLVDDEKEIDHIWWSKNRGNTWERYDLGISIRARYLTTDPTSSSSKFLLIGSSRFSNERVQSFYIDLSGVFSHKCELIENNESKSDFERWFARDLTSGPDCLMGHEQMFYRRKADRDCYVGLDFQPPVVELKECPCTEADYECDYNFVRDGDKCVRIGPDVITKDMCTSRNSVYPSSSGYRLIPGNTCNAEKGKKLDEPVDRRCGDNEDASYAQPPRPTQPSTGNNNHGPIEALAPGDSAIERFETVFDDEIDQFVYFKESPAMLLRLRNGELWSSGEHGIGWKHVLQDKGVIRSFIMHEFDFNRAYALTDETIYVTSNQGAQWEEIKVPLAPTKHIALALDFHPLEKDWLLFIGDSTTVSSQSEVFISRNHGRDWDSMDMYVSKCIFGRDSHYEIEKETVFCSSVDKKNPTGDRRLVRTIDWGRNQEVLFDNVVEFFVIEDFMSVASSVKGALSMYVSTNGKTFTEAQFPPNQYIDRNTFTVLQSTTHAVLLNVFKSVTYGKAHGALYKSNEDGTLYHLSLDNTNGDATGFVDFEKMQSIDGVILANQVYNADELLGNRDVAKLVRTMITWDDGGHWQPLSAPHNYDCATKECTLNLHSRTDIHGPGAIFSTTGAPGLAMGVGNVGASLLPYEQSDTFLTRDGGHTWIEIQRGEHLYEFGDQGSLLVLISDEGPTNELKYSWDQGETWHGYVFSSSPIRVNALTTDPKSTTLRFVIVGHTRDTKRSQISITVDFSKVKQRTCEMDKSRTEKSDFELWVAKDDDGDDACLLGKKTAYWRRKKDRVCIVGNRFKEPEVVQEKCECRDTDFECDFGFWLNDKNECVFYGRHPDRPAKCKDGETYRGRSGFKKNTKSVCEGGLDLEKEKEWPCGEGGGIQSSKMSFTDRVVDYLFFTDTDRVFVRTADNKVWKSDNDGYSWKELFPNVPIVAMYQNPHFDDHAYFITQEKSHFMTTDKGSNIEPFDAPLGPMASIQGTMMSFHKEEKNKVIYLGETNCETQMSSDCHSQAFYSQDQGRSWRPIATYVRSCLWGRGGTMENTDENSIFCEEYQEKKGNQRSFISNRLSFTSSNNYYSSSETLFDAIVGVAVFGKFMVIAAPKGSGTSLSLHISMDGKTFAQAAFPASLNLSPEAFTIMESANSMWIHVSTNTHHGSEYGTIFTSNSNGTYFVASLENANRNEIGIVDFEKMQGIEGIALANRVSNPNQANMGDPKKLVTMKTADAGAHWFPLTAPQKDSKGKNYDNCKRGVDCNLHLHSYSERRNTRDLFSLSSAVGLMVGVGNVGPSLSTYRSGDMFLTRDAGKTWNEVYKGAHLWEFADQGALLILVDDEDPTNVVKYTTNEGISWQEYAFTTPEKRLKVEDIITQPDGTSQKYVIFGTEYGSSNVVAYHIDFSALHPTKCKLDLSHPSDDDFELWSPEDTRGEACLFGREVKRCKPIYIRIQDRDCYIGEKLVQPREEVRNCACQQEDYECDFNFVRDKNNKCVLVPGLSPRVPECDGSMEFFYEPTGYRRIAATSCEGGLGLDEGEKHWCPGKSHSSGMWAVYVFAPLGGALLIFACLYLRKYGAPINRGRIRLADGTTQQSSGTSLSSNPLVATIVSAIILIPVAVMGLLSRIRVPSSFSDLNVFSNVSLPSFGRRGSNHYSALGQDEHADVLLDDYDGGEENLIDDVDADEEDADEFY